MLAAAVPENEPSRLNTSLNHVAMGTQHVACRTVLLLTPFLVSEWEEKIYAANQPQPHVYEISR